MQRTAVWRTNTLTVRRLLNGAAGRRYASCSTWSPAEVPLRPAVDADGELADLSWAHVCS